MNCSWYQQRALRTPCFPIEMAPISSRVNLGTMTSIKEWLLIEKTRVPSYS